MARALTILKISFFSNLKKDEGVSIPMVGGLGPRAKKKRLINAWLTSKRGISSKSDILPYNRSSSLHYRRPCFDIGGVVGLPMTMRWW